MLAVAAWTTRFIDLEAPRSNFPDLFDEGIRAEQLFLMSRGFRPFRDIYAAQGPLLLDTLYPFYAWFGETLGSIRLGVGVLSLVGVAGAYFAARQAGGRLGGLVATALLVGNAAYLEGSRLALAEVPSLAPSLVALALALRYQASGSRGWLAASAAVGTVGLLMKPMVVPVCLAIATIAVVRAWGLDARSGLRLAVRDAGLGLAIALALTSAVVLLMGPRDVYEQLVVYRANATGASGWDWRSAWKEAVAGPVAAQPALYALALVAGGTACWLDPAVRPARRVGRRVVWALVRVYAVASEAPGVRGSAGRLAERGRYRHCLEQPGGRSSISRGGAGAATFAGAVLLGAFCDARRPGPWYSGGA
ncbi:MAG: glycosyltransferase family 39 protein [Chloroflexota bacterium]